MVRKQNNILPSNTDLPTEVLNDTAIKETGKYVISSLS